MVEEDTHCYLWPPTPTSIHNTYAIVMSFYLAFQMCLLGLWGGEVEEIGNTLGRIVFF